MPKYISTKQAYKQLNCLPQKIKNKNKNLYKHAEVRIANILNAILDMVQQEHPNDNYCQQLATPNELRLQSLIPPVINQCV